MINAKQEAVEACGKEIVNLQTHIIANKADIANNWIEISTLKDIIHVEHQLSIKNREAPANLFLMVFFLHFCY